MTQARTWQDETKSLWHALDGNIEELTRRIDALEARLPKPIPVVTPLAPRCPCEDGSLCALVMGSKAHPWPACARCGGPVDPERHCYAQPTCYRCLPPPDPLPVRAVTPPRIALPDYLLAPTPDYRSEPPGEVDACGCEEAEALRAELGAASVELRQVAERAENAERERDAAQARADAAEQDNGKYRRALQLIREQLEECESECAALRAERDAALELVQRAGEAAERSAWGASPSSWMGRSAVAELARREGKR